jgi:Holliday junction resolvasome RuvABC ATP-dependent DNA helicase subunit
MMHEYGRHWSIGDSFDARVRLTPGAPRLTTIRGILQIDRTEDGGVVFTPTVLDFSDGQPDCLDPADGSIPYRGQDEVKRRLLLHIQGLGPTTRVKALFTGPAGNGKTSLARIVAAQIRRRHVCLGLPGGEYYELLPAQVEAKAQLDAFVRQIVQDPFATIFIDEIHTLTHAENLFHVLHDTGEPRYALENGSWVPVPQTISWLAATTDPGELDRTTGGALRRRLEPEFRLKAPDPDVLADIVMDQGVKEGLTIERLGAYDIAQRALFPWQAKLLFREAVLLAKASGSASLTRDHVWEAFDLMAIDEHGLVAEDRDVIRALLQSPYRLASQPHVTRYKMSEAALCASAGVDRLTYQKRIQPKLMRHGFLTTVGGQCLTEKALTYYGWLRSAA